MAEREAFSKARPDLSQALYTLSQVATETAG